MKKGLVWLLLMVAGLSHASDVKCSKPLFYVEETETYAVFNLEWKNAWKNQLNNDAVWIFFKIKEAGKAPAHVNVASSGHQIINVFDQDPQLGFRHAADQVGVFVFPSSDFRGDVLVTVKVLLDAKSLEGINVRRAALDVFAVEMVQIPKGGYYVGAPRPELRKWGAMYSPQTDGLVKINSEDQKLSISEQGDLYYEKPEGYEGDQQGPIPSSYPKGVASYFMMKYELSEGQYVDFLNNLSSEQQEDRQVQLTDDYNGTIVRQDGFFSTPNRERPASFVGWDDAMAYADWAGLRPMTELEYTKAARGTAEPSGLDYPWGAADKASIQRLPNSDGTLIMVNGMNESELTEKTRHFFGASPYWVMDLAGSLWERVITIGHEKGRSFTGVHGDGALTPDGYADQGWPIAERESGGIGFRGGGFYGYDREYHDFNPFSPVFYRPYGGWHGGMRSIAYGTRFVRTAD